jgi:uncharacterized membrane protein
MAVFVDNMLSRSTRKPLYRKPQSSLRNTNLRGHLMTITKKEIFDLIGAGLLVVFFLWVFWVYGTYFYKKILEIPTQVTHIKQLIQSPESK